METTCEFCTALRPVVYCKSDAAHLCLPCDSKVHSANALSSRHPRTLVCELCRYRPAYIRCSDHQMFMCRGCYHLQHGITLKPEKKVIRSYIGCPSAKELAALWGFDFSKLENGAFQGGLVSSSSGSANKESDMDTNQPISRHAKAFYKAEQQEKTSIIMQQLLDLKRLQLDVGTGDLSLIIGQEKNGMPGSKYDSIWKHGNDIDQDLQSSSGLDDDPRQMDSPLGDASMESFSSQFSQLDHLTPSSTTGNPLHGDTFWQSKSSVWSGQLWPQNMQDLGVCEDLERFDDLNIPDVDLTFRNFEELFGGEKELTCGLLDEKDLTSPSVEKNMSLDGSENSFVRAIKDDSVASSVDMAQSAHVDKAAGPSDQDRYLSVSVDNSWPMQPLSGLSADSCDSAYVKTKLSPIVRQESTCNSLEPGSANLEAKESILRMDQVKKKVRRHDKLIQHTSLKARSDARKRIRSQFVKAEGCEADVAKSTQSYF